MTLTQTYLKRAAELTLPGTYTGSDQVGWRSPSNIALVKYWGKKENQVPCNPSLSFTLTRSFTDTLVEYSTNMAAGGLEMEFLFDGSPHPAFAERVRSYLKSITTFLPFLNGLVLKISSFNSFPHSSGIASSASSMSALALCLVDIEQQVFNTLHDRSEFFRKAAFLGRLGSGSATRSVYGDFVAWGETGIVPGSSDEVGVPYEIPAGNSFLELNDAILVTSMGKKKVSSSHGHGMMVDHPYARSRYRQAVDNLAVLDAAIRSENDEKFIGIIENEALSLHALMLSSNPGYTLLNENTWQIIHRIREFREKTGNFMGFSLDAGPNVHLIYKEQDKDATKEFIENELATYCENGYWIDDKIGSGPVKLN